MSGARRVLVCGAGRMGQLVASACRERGWDVVDVIGVGEESRADGLVGDRTPDVVIDFSAPAAHDWLLPFVRETGATLVSGTTGLDEVRQAALDELAQHVPVMWSSNYSVGIAALSRALSLVSGVLEGWDCEIVERHHNRKADAPSGTALSLADAVDPGHRLERVCGRSGMQPRSDHEIGLSSVRGGTVAGIHEVAFYGEAEQLSFAHVAESRQIFVVGAVHAVELLEGRAPGRYQFADLLFEGSKGEES
ncbi:MAG: 4-hydroxy-tetrahydrodipicolinate reductase [Atopobiaceae bacterium]|nr:4-hydroxy-tetrahydrodipicolinate reductase [Atopobiaceae bacterium]